jgi:PHS family inorganic phosphate transporter-like MFS transporter
VVVICAWNHADGERSRLPLGMSKETHVASRPSSVVAALNEAPLSMFHLRAVLTSGLGFFTDAYDLFIIGSALVLIKAQWHISKPEVALVGSISLIATFAGAFIFGRVSDLLGRKRIYGLEAAIMVIGALGSAFAPTVTWLIAFRFILGLGIGGDYPVSSVLMSEYSNQKNRGKLVGMVFSMQALGTVIGPAVALALVASGISHGLDWRILLGLGALPAAGAIYFRRKMPESPRYTARVQGDAKRAAAGLNSYSEGVVSVGSDSAEPTRRMGLADFLSNPRYLLLLLGTAGSWFVFDYAYYGNTISSAQIFKLIQPSMPLTRDLALTFIIFAVSAVPGYALAFLTMDRIGHKKLQLIGFAIMGLSFLSIGVLPGVAKDIAPFILIFGLSYFFAEFGPNTTTFVIASEVYPVSMRGTGAGMSAGFAKVGAFIGVFAFPFLSAHFGLHGTLTITAVFAALGFLVTLVLPEPSGRSLEEVSGEDDVALEATRLLHTAEPVLG